MSTTEIRIAIDCMGGDAGLPVTVPAAHQFAKQNPDTRFLLAGDPAAIETRLVALGSLGRDWYEILPASEVVAMADSVEVALRRHKDSSMRVAVPDRTSVVSGKSVSVRVDLGGRRILKKTHNIYNHTAN